ncbi:hypothetical protein NLG97_g834 [Lecanicillium saksenae]|uniref:Uncharacterized protein n=1 Tax=Lecanicillium saksenae TaxID=468837 RepID=A0ACC1R844_9HYPO|nr:hypothetical protein NLG97_g834 [Lecanicillium saksenae]
MNNFLLWTLFLAGGVISPVQSRLGTLEARTSVRNDWGCQSPYNPVVVLHGLFASRNADLNFLESFLRPMGYCTFGLTYGVLGAFSNVGGVQSIEESSDQVANFIREVLEKTGTSQVDLVGHSEGGFQALIVALAPVTAGTEYRNLITFFDLIRPFVKLTLAFRGCPACHDLSLGGTPVRQLNQGPIVQPANEVTIIATKYDTVVTPAGSASFVYEPMVYNTFIQDVCAWDFTSHNGLALDPNAFQLVHNALSGNNGPENLIAWVCFSFTPLAAAAAYLHATDSLQSQGSKLNRGQVAKLVTPYPLQMAAVASETALRYLGPIELYFASRHPIGLYRAVIVTARYVGCGLTSSHDGHINPSGRFIRALTSMIHSHPMLRVSIQNESSNQAYFLSLAEMDLRKHVTVSSLDCSTEEDLNEQVAKQQQLQHDRLWTDIHAKAPWRIEILRNDNEFLGCSEDLMFVFHHSIMDGKSGMLFHRFFHAKLAESPESEELSTHELSFSSTACLPDSQEKIVPFAFTTRFMIELLWKRLASTALRLPSRRRLWGGKPVSFSLPFSTGILFLDFCASVTRVLRVACREKGTTLTGLIHALTFASLTRALEPDLRAAFKSVTPACLRDYCREKLGRDMSNTLSLMLYSIDHQFTPATVASMRDAINGGRDELNSEIWHTAKRIRHDIVANSDALPNNTTAGTLKFISDFREYWAEKDGKPRLNSWECSNIGAYKMQCPQWQGKIARIFFSNGASVTGAAIGVNVASVDGGNLTLALSWQQQIVSESVITNVRDNLEKLVHGYCRTQSWLL